MKYKALLDQIDAQLKKLALSERKACLRADVGIKAVQHIRNGHAPRPETLRRLAIALQLPPNRLLELAPAEMVEDRGPQMEPIPVIGTVQAGNWVEAIERPISEQTIIWLPPQRRYEGIQRKALDVRGTSMNLRYPDGSTIVVVRFWDLGRGPVSGERVVIQRKNRQGLYEATVKLLDIQPDGRVWLVPESSDPEHQRPIPMGEMTLSDGQIAIDTVYTDGFDLDGEIEFIALVIGSYRPE